MAKQSRRVPVSVRAVTQRINRKLAPGGRQLRKCRSERWRSELGNYYLLDIAHNAVMTRHVDLEALGRELGALEEWETVASE
jgi:hypothetical protein